MSGYKTVPHDGPLFETMKREIDAHLCREGFTQQPARRLRRIRQ